MEKWIKVLMIMSRGAIVDFKKYKLTFIDNQLCSYDAENNSFYQINITLNQFINDCKIVSEKDIVEAIENISPNKNSRRISNGI
jgi:hypothetical protein